MGTFGISMNRGMKYKKGDKDLIQSKYSKQACYASNDIK